MRGEGWIARQQFRSRVPRRLFVDFRRKPGCCSYQQVSGAFKCRFGVARKSFFWSFRLVESLGFKRCVYRRLVAAVATVV